VNPTLRGSFCEPTAPRPGYDRRPTMLCRPKPTRGDCGSFPAAADLTPGYERPHPLDPPPLRLRDRGQRKTAVRSAV
jgi:hypothetical protein